MGVNEFIIDREREREIEGGGSKNIKGVSKNLFH